MPECTTLGPHAIYVLAFSHNFQEQMQDVIFRIYLQNNNNHELTNFNYRGSCSLFSFHFLSFGSAFSRSFHQVFELSSSFRTFSANQRKTLDIGSEKSVKSQNDLTKMEQPIDLLFSRWLKFRDPCFAKLTAC